MVRIGLAALVTAVVSAFAIAERVPGAYIFEFIDGFVSPPLYTTATSSDVPANR